MEERKSVLETTKPADSLGKITDRQRHGRMVSIAIAVIVVFGLVFLVATIIYNTTQGTAGLKVPAVSR